MRANVGVMKHKTRFKKISRLTNNLEGEYKKLGARKKKVKSLQNQIDSEYKKFDAESKILSKGSK
jgi:DNA repair ATPase RecN